MKSKFLCFRPFGIETESEPDCFGDQAFSCITVPNYRDAKISVAKSPVLDSDSLKRSKSAIKSESNRSFSGVLKSVLFEISLRKKARNRKAPQLMLDSESSDSSTSKAQESSDSSTRRIKRKSTASESVAEENRRQHQNQKSSSDNKFPSKTRPSFSKQRKQRTRECSELKTENKVISSSSANSALLLILVALSITMFYGRICAILFTTLCLYFLPSRSIWERQPENTKNSLPEEESGRRLEEESHNGRAAREKPPAARA